MNDNYSDEFFPLSLLCFRRWFYVFYFLYVALQFYTSSMLYINVKALAWKLYCPYNFDKGTIASTPRYKSVPIGNVAHCHGAGNAGPKLYSYALSFRLWCIANAQIAYLIMYKERNSGLVESSSTNQAELPADPYNENLIQTLPCSAHRQCARKYSH